MSDHKIQVVFMGTPEFALPPLQSLLDDPEFDIQAVVTKEDKRAGRKQELTVTPVKLLAAENDVTVLQPAKIKGNQQLIELLTGLKPDFIVVVAYGHILPREILEIPRYGCVNIHASLLPKYRGASPIEEALLHGDRETGVTFIQMTEKLDCGPVYFVKKLPIEADDTSISLRIKLSVLAGSMLPIVLRDIKDGVLRGIPQNELQASYCRKIEKDNGKIVLADLTAEEIRNRIRAYTPWPSCFIIIDNKRMKILEADIDMTKNLQPGETADIDKNSIGIGTKKGIIIPKKVQLEGKKVMTIQEFLAGNRNLLAKLLARPK